MSNKDQCEALRDLMTNYNAGRKAWIDFHGSSEGFDAWFTTQVNAL